MSIYGTLTDAELDAKIASLTESYERVVQGGTAVVVAGEGRRIEYGRPNMTGLMALLKDAQREKMRRAGVQVSGAIRVSFPYGDGYGRY